MAGTLLFWGRLNGKIFGVGMLSLSAIDMKIASVSAWYRGGLGCVGVSDELFVVYPVSLLHGAPGYGLVGRS